MREERQMILTMLQEGKITAEEAQDLLEALALGQETVNERAAEQWAEVKDRFERAGDIVEKRLEQARHTIEQRIEDARGRIDAAREKASRDEDYPIESLEDVVVTVERGFTQFAKEFPEAIGRLFRFDFDLGALGGHRVERVYEGAFAVGLAEANVAVSTRHGSIRWETWAEPGYKVVVTNQVRAEDEATAEERADAATSWAQTDRGFRLVAGDKRGVSSQVRVLVPRGIPLRVESETRNGSNRGADLLLSSASFHTANGSIRLENVDARDLQMTTANGSIRVAGVVDTLRGTTAQGFIDVRMAATGGGEDGEGGERREGARRVERANWELRTSNGSIKAQVPGGDAVGYDVDLKTVNGRVRLDLPGLDVQSDGRGRRGAVGQSPDFETKAQRISVSARTANGSITVDAGGMN